MQTISASEQTEVANTVAKKQAAKEVKPAQDKPNENQLVKKAEGGGSIVFGTVFDVGQNYEIVSPIG